MIVSYQLRVRLSCVFSGESSTFDCVSREMAHDFHPRALAELHPHTISESHPLSASRSTTMRYQHPDVHTTSLTWSFLIGKKPPPADVFDTRRDLLPR